MKSALFGGKSILKSLFLIVVTVAVVSGATYAAWTAQAKVEGNTFSTGSAALKLYGNLAGTPGVNANLTDLLPGNSFDDVYPNWEEYYPAKLYNSGTVNLKTTVKGVYVSQTAALQDYIKVAVYKWNDDGDGVYEEGEKETLAYQNWKTLREWRTNPILLGQVDAKATLPLVFRFKTEEDLPNSLQNQNTVFDFVFDGTTEGATTTLPSPSPL